MSEQQMTPFMHAQPHPITTASGVAEFPNGIKMVVVLMETPNGSERHFFSPEHARALAEEMISSANQIDHSGIQVAQDIPMHLPKPGGNGAPDH